MLAALVVLAALAVRLAVPAGYMPVVGVDGVTLSICTGAGPLQMAASGHDMHNMHNMHNMPHGQQDIDTQGRCAFADLALPAIGGADPFQLAAALAFILAVGLVPLVPLVLRDIPRLRPPLRGPPHPR